MRTFIVEDNLVLQENLVSTLHELTSLKVVGTAVGESQALAWLHAHPREWDVVLVDLFLQQGSGLGLLHGLRRSPGQTVLVLSNYVIDVIRQRCCELGADAVFDKSTQSQALIHRCRELGLSHTRSSDRRWLAAAA